MTRIPLSDEKTRVIFGGETLSNLAALDATKQRIVLERLLTILERAAPPDQFIYEKIGNVDIIRAGGQCRLYTKVITNVPREDTEYHVIYVLYIDSEHEYNQADLATYSGYAQARLEEVTSLATVSDVEAYLDENNAFSHDDLFDLLDGG